MKKIWIVYFSAGLTHNYHSGGYVVVKAKDEQEAKEAAKPVRRPPDCEWEISAVVEFTGEPVVLADAGCC